MTDANTLSRKELMAKCKQFKADGLLDPSVKCNGTSAYLVEQIEAAQGNVSTASRTPAKRSLRQ